MRKWIGVFLPFFLAACASQSLSPESKMNPGKGIVYATMNSVEKSLYTNYRFKQGDAEKVFIVNRSMMDKRDTLIVMEMDPGTWTLEKIELNSIVGEDTHDYPFSEIPKVEFKVVGGKLNYLARIEIEEDCEVPAVAMRGTPAKCVEYGIAFKNEKAIADAEMRKRYKFLVPEESAGSCIVGDSPAIVKGKFLKPVVVMKIHMNPNSKTPFNASPFDPGTTTIKVVK